MSASPLASPFHPPLPRLSLPSLVLVEQQKPSRRQWQVTLWMKVPESNGCHSARQRSERNQRKKGFSWRGMEGGEEGAEVEMWTEVVECRPRGSEPLIDCSGLTEALCDCHFQHRHTHTHTHTHTHSTVAELWGPSPTFPPSTLHSDRRNYTHRLPPQLNLIWISFVEVLISISDIRTSRRAQLVWTNVFLKQQCSVVLQGESVTHSRCSKDTKFAAQQSHSESLRSIVFIICARAE